MMTDLLSRCMRGLRVYKNQYPQIYQGYEHDIEQIIAKMNNLHVSLCFLDMEERHKDDPLPAQKTD